MDPLKGPVEAVSTKEHAVDCASSGGKKKKRKPDDASVQRENKRFSMFFVPCFFVLSSFYLVVHRHSLCHSLAFHFLMWY